MRKRMILVFLLMLFSTHSPAQTTATVSRVIDGDTIDLSTGKCVRLIGVDTPEESEYYGNEASAFTKRMAEGKTVRLEFDVEQRDQYGHLLAYVYLEDGTFLNAEIVRQGYGKILTIPPNVKHAKEFLKFQQVARYAGSGLWGAGAPPTEKQSAAAVQKQPAAGGVTVYVQECCMTYHLAGCVMLSGTTSIQMSLEETKMRRYRPCAICKPPI